MSDDAVPPILEELKTELGPELIRLLDEVDPSDLGTLDAAWDAVLAEVVGES